jgi:hypothetical protein
MAEEQLYGMRWHQSKHEFIQTHEDFYLKRDNEACDQLRMMTISIRQLDSEASMTRKYNL